MAVYKIELSKPNFRVYSHANSSLLYTNPKLYGIILSVDPRDGYMKKWTEGHSSNELPSCVSYDGKKPHDSSMAKQNDICATCPKNMWGSKITPRGKKAKACLDIKQLLVFVPNLSKDVYTILLAPTSIRALDKYRKLLRDRNTPLHMAKTAIYYDDTVNYAKLSFAYKGHFDSKIQNYINNLINLKEVLHASQNPTLHYSDNPYGF